MLRSLRFRLPALFLLGVVLSGVIATLIAIRFFQSYTHTRAIAELRSESVGIVELYARQAGVQKVPLANLEKAIGRDRIFFVPIVPGASLVAGTIPPLKPSQVPLGELKKQGTVTVDLHTRGQHYLAVAQLVRLGQLPAGALPFPTGGRPGGEGGFQWRRQPGH